MKSTERFGTRAKAYAAFRPSYPPGAIDAALDGLGDPCVLTVADVGAGTGISARVFAERGVRVIAIEPNAKMRAAAQLHDLVSWHEGTGEHTGLGNASVDAIVACQAFHWFATPKALREFRRVARRRAAVLQYEREECDDFTRTYGDIVRAYATDDTEELRRRALEFFAAFPDARITQTAHRSRQRLDRDALFGRASSSSYLPQTGPEAERLRRDLNALFDRYARGGYADLAMVTYVFAADW
jgi:SAM-dependent methyltransferase